MATALVDTGSRMDDVIFEEFKGTGNLEIVLSRKIMEKQYFPPLTSTRVGRDAKILLDLKSIGISLTRRVLADLEPAEAMELLLGKVAKSNSVQNS